MNLNSFCASKFIVIFFRKKKLETKKSELEIVEDRNEVLKEKEDGLKKKIATLQKYLLFAIKNNQFKCGK